MAMWANMVLKLLLFIRPVLRMLQNLCRPEPMETIRLMRGRREEIPLTYLNEVHTELDQVIKNRRREREPMASPTSSGYSEKSGSPDPPRGPPPPAPVNQPRPSSAAGLVPRNHSPTSNSSLASNRQSRARSSYSTGSATTSVSRFEMIQHQQPVMEIIEEKLIDKNLQNRVLEQGAQILFNDIPACHCDKVAGVEVTLKSGPNYQKVFFRCFNPPTKVQCRFFAWAPEQPLLEARYSQLRQEVQQHCQSSPRELLCQLIQAQCNHRYGWTNTGTNQHYIMKRCRICHKMMERYRRPRTTQPPINEEYSMGNSRETDYEDWMEDRRR